MQQTQHEILSNVMCKNRFGIIQESNQALTMIVQLYAHQMIIDAILCNTRCRMTIILNEQKN